MFPWPTMVGFPGVVSCSPWACLRWLLVASQATRRNRKKLKKKIENGPWAKRSLWPPLGISLLFLSSAYRGSRSGSRGALDLQGACFLFRNGICPGAGVGHGNLIGKILPPCVAPLMAAVGSAGWFHAPAVGIERKNSGCHGPSATSRQAAKNSVRAPWREGASILRGRRCVRSRIFGRSPRRAH